MAMCYIYACKRYNTHNGDVIEEEVEALSSVLEHLIDSLRHHLSLGDQLTHIKPTEPTAHMEKLFKKTL